MGESRYTDRFLEAVERWDGSLLGPSRENRGVEGIAVFRSDFVERFVATAHPALPGVVWGPVVSLCLYLSATAVDSALLPIVLRFVTGLLLWTLTEYLLHRFPFHRAPGSSLESKIRQFMMHGYHHEFPNHRRRLVAPLILSVPIAVPLLILYMAIFGSQHALAYFAGTVSGYIAYDWIHYYTHHFRPTTRLGKFLRRYHMEHHYKDSDSHFGISSPLWDWVFGTTGTVGPTDIERMGAGMGPSSSTPDSA
ncbi:MAG: sterol desaturase family protein [Myxococcales bacterium]|nr:sterol desaturase family protein [Myxococcales bacterium]